MSWNVKRVDFYTSWDASISHPADSLKEAIKAYVGEFRPGADRVCHIVKGTE